MKRTLTALALGALMTVPPVLAPSAEASHGDWVFGARFRVGDALFNIGFVPQSIGYGHYRPVYYYRTPEPLRYRGHRCHDRCYHRGGYSYHYATCPLVQRHFRHHNLHPRSVFVRHAPRYRGYDERYYDGYYDRGYYDHGRWDRDRHHDRRGRGSYRDDDRGRGRGHYRDRKHDDRHRHGRHDRDRHRGHRHRGGHCEYDD